MLFYEEDLRSVFDFDKKLNDSQATIDILSLELYCISEQLHFFYKEGKSIIFKYTDQNDETVCIDFNNVSESTWYRTPNEIKEILYRPKINGIFQQQFSINKGLELFNVYEPSDIDDYKNYLKLLYFFYITNYFVFPKKNIFKLLRKDNISYVKSYDQGVEEGKYISFILSSLLSIDETLFPFIHKTSALSQISDYVSIHIKSTIYNSLLDNDDIINECTNEVEACILDNVLDSAIAYFHNFAMKSYSVDLINNLASDQKIFKFEKVTVQPSSSWKHTFIPLDNLQQFLYSNELYSFCMQTNKKIESRDKIKFNNSNAITFLSKIIQYDLQWIEDFNEEYTGNVIQVISGKPYIYALRIAVMIMTYNELTNKLKVRLLSKDNTNAKPLKTILNANWCSNDIVPPTLAIRYFILASHSQYENITNDNDYYDDFYNKFIIPEIIIMKIFKNAYTYNNIDESITYLQILSDQLF